MDTFSPFVIGLAGVGVAGFVAWTVNSITNIREEYVKRDSFDELRREFRQEFRSLQTLVIEIAGKLGVPVRLE